MKYSIEGEMLLRGNLRKFTKEVEAENQKRALEIAYATLGSTHRLSRKDIKVKSVKEVS